MQNIETSLIAPCGMDCALCRAYQRDKKSCKGCNSVDIAKPAYCFKCVIRNCKTIQSNASGFCYECNRYPCLRLRQLDARYCTKYNMSMIKNLEQIKENGTDAFLQNEVNRWTCQECGSIVCVHNGICPQCKTPYK